MTSLIPADGAVPWGDLFRTLWRVGHNDDGTHKNGRQVGFARAGTLVVTTGAGTYPIVAATSIVGVILRAGTAPTGTTSTPISGASLVCDVNKNGTTVFTTQANRPRIASGVFLSATAVPDVTALAPGDWLSVDIDYVGSTVAGADLTVLVVLSA